MRIAFLILAHNTPSHLARLITALRHPDHRFFIHVDKKQDVTPFEKVAAQDVSFIDRIEVEWGDITGVKAALLLMKTARAAGPFDYYFLMSGSDYPLYTADEINRFFADHQGYEFLDSVEMPAPQAGKPASRLENFYPKKGRGFTLLEKLRSRYYRNRKRDFRAALRGVVPHGGSAWFALTDKAVDEVLRFPREEPGAAAFLVNTYIPEETYFQTVIANSPVMANVTRNLTYTDWSRGGPSPKNLTEADLHLFEKDLIADEAAHSGPGVYLFARKFLDGSEPLTSEIDRMAAGKSVPDRLSSRHRPRVPA